MFQRLQSRQVLGQNGGPQVNGINNPATMDLSRPPPVASARSSGLV